MNIFNKIYPNFVYSIVKLNDMKSKLLLITIISVSLLYSCGVSKVKNETSKFSFYEKGEASWYGPGFNGKKTANGETFDMYKLTAAHKKLAFGTKVRVTNLNNDKSVIVRINDRGPFVKGRVIDLSKKAAQQIEMINAGHVPVKIEIFK